MAEMRGFWTFVQMVTTAHFSPSFIPQRMTASLKVFRCGPRRNVCGHVVAARVDKPRKEEAAGFWGQSMGKVR